MSNLNQIVIEGACENNLRNISLKIPKNKLVVVTGVSGSGKSSLAFDTIYAEGYRRYIENLSGSAHFLLNPVKKPKVEKIENIPPAIAISQNFNAYNPRSTVGTFTGVYDLLRTLFAYFGEPHCPACGEKMFGQNLESTVDKLKKLERGTRLVIVAKWEGKQDGMKNRLTAIGNLGYARVRIENKIVAVQESRMKKWDEEEKNIEVVIDRIMLDGKRFDKERIIDSFQTAVKISKNNSKIVIDNEKEIFFNQNIVCPNGCIVLEKISPKNFSFNSPEGACLKCDGLGEVAEADIERIIPNKKLALAEGAIIPWLKEGGRQDKNNFCNQILKGLSKKYGFSLKTPVEKIPEEKLNKLYYGTGEEEIEIKTSKGKKKIKFEGLVTQLEKKYHEAESFLTKSEVKKYMIVKKCSVCKGGRLKEPFLHVKLFGKTIDGVVNMEINDLLDFFNNDSDEAKVSKNESEEKFENVHKNLVQEIVSRLTPLAKIGVDYLSLDRSCQSLSGGEFQRVRIASQLYSGLSSVVYILDEPSIGLHSRDTKKLIETLRQLRDQGNSLVIVEHDKDIIKAADYIIDLGPGAGENGGRIVFQGNAVDFEKSQSKTSQYLIKTKGFKKRKKGKKNERKITIKGANHNNLKNIDVDIPLGKLVAIAGVSGGGKSSLINDILVKVLRRDLLKADEHPGSYRNIIGLKNISKIINVDQSPIGRSCRSNPATYTGVFNHIRELFAETETAKKKGFSASYFSFNMKGGRCEYCQGEGATKIEMHFLDDVFAVCPHCRGSRYSKKIKDIKYHGVDIAEVLDMNIEYAYHFFTSHSVIKNKLKTLRDVGLGYLKLGQSATELSGGEAQRIKLATELARKSNGKALYVLDEPTIGLHFSDVAKLLNILQELVAKGNSVLIIEHNLDVINVCDWVIELGPEGGNSGGELIFEGTPKQLKKAKTWTSRMM
jgi:excinuclease ABC subunit A